VNMSPLEEQAKLTEEFVRRVDEITQNAVKEMQSAGSREPPTYRV
jgi:proteasome assembly chaperone (PAC2) family protein